jgi:hypothetical protein
VSEVIYVRRSRKRIRQGFWVTIVDAGNRKTLFHSEMLRNRHYAFELATRFERKLGAKVVDLT